MSDQTIVGLNIKERKRRKMNWYDYIAGFASGMIFTGLTIRFFVWAIERGSGKGSDTR